jgi:hypothetical protein
MECMEIDYQGEGRFKPIGPARWDDLAYWARSFRRVREVDWAGYTAIYAVTCTLGSVHHFLVQESPDKKRAARTAPTTTPDSQGGSGSP